MPGPTTRPARREFWIRWQTTDGRTFWSRERATSRTAAIASHEAKCRAEGTEGRAIKVQRANPYR